MKVPRGTFGNSLDLDYTRHFPSIECLDNSEKEELNQRTEKIIDFHSDAKLAYQAVNYVREWLLNSDFDQRNLLEDCSSKNNKYFFLDHWQESSLIAVKEGKKPITDGFRLILAHADSPCLRIKTRPIKIESDDRELYNSLGVKLSTIPHGGIVVPYWIGQPVKIMGYSIDKNNLRKEISFPGFVGVNSAHVDFSEYEQVNEAFSPEKSLEIIPGFSSPKSLLNKLQFDSIDDFSTTSLWAVPMNKMFALGGDSPNLLVGYGHDNRTSVFSSIDALVNSNDNEYASIVWVSDNEEIFDPSPVGTKGPFLNIFLERIFEEFEKKENRKVSQTEKQNMYKNSKIIVGDVTVAPFGNDKITMDSQSAAKIGLGAFIEDGSIRGNDLYFMRHLRNIASDEKICHQVCGQFYHQDLMNLWYGGGDHNRKGISEIWAGIPCASCHSFVEVICPGDEYATSKLYRKFFESK